jgi:hypothetical protein
MIINIHSFHWYLVTILCQNVSNKISNQFLFFLVDINYVLKKRYGGGN